MYVHKITGPAAIHHLADVSAVALHLPTPMTFAGISGMAIDKSGKRPSIAQSPMCCFSERASITPPAPFRHLNYRSISPHSSLRACNLNAPHRPHPQSWPRRNKLGSSLWRINGLGKPNTILKRNVLSVNAPTENIDHISDKIMQVLSMKVAICAWSPRSSTHVLFSCHLVSSETHGSKVRSVSYTVGYNRLNQPWRNVLRWNSLLYHDRSFGKWHLHRLARRKMGNGDDWSKETNHQLHFHTGLVTFSLPCHPHSTFVSPGIGVDLHCLPFTRHATFTIVTHCRWATSPPILRAKSIENSGACGHFYCDVVGVTSNNCCSDISQIQNWIILILRLKIIVE